VSSKGVITGGYIVKLFELSRAFESTTTFSCIPLLLTGRSNHCQDCFFSTHFEFSSLVSILVKKGLIDGIGMAMNLQESPATYDDIFAVMHYYTSQGLNVYITGLDGTPKEIDLVTKICIGNTRCVVLNLNIAEVGEYTVASRLTNHSQNWNPREAIAPFCPSMIARFILHDQTLTGTTIGTNNTLGGDANDALFKFRITKANGVDVKLKVCAASSSPNFQTTIEVYNDKDYRSRERIIGGSQVLNCNGASMAVLNQLPKGWYYVLVEGQTPTDQGDFSISLTLVNQTNTAKTQSTNAATHPMAGFLNFLVAGIISLVLGP